MSAKDKYSAYCYLCAKQGITPLSFNAWMSVKNGRIILHYQDTVMDKIML